MKHNKELAFEMRRQGRSYKEIQREIGIPVSTLTGWFKKELWSEEIKLQLIQRQITSSGKHMERMRLANIARFENIRKQHREEAIQEFPKFKSNPLFISALMLYWGEGDKVAKNGRVKLTNGEPLMIRVFYNFLKKINVPEEKIRLRLLLYPDLIDAVQKNFWSKVTGITIDRFNKSIVIKGRHTSRRLSYGVCNIEVYSRGLKEKILKWLELYQNELISLKV